MSVRTATIPVLALASLLAGACAGGPRAASPQSIEAVIASLEGEVPESLAEPERFSATRQLGPPPDVPAELIQPRRGSELKRANLSLAAVLEKLTSRDAPPAPPPALAAPDTADGDAAADAPAREQEQDGERSDDEAADEDAAPDPPRPHDEPSLRVQRAYLQARAAQYEGDPRRGLAALAPALREAPDEPALLRLAGEFYLGIGDGPSALISFRRALAQRPDDVPSLYFLGRYHFSQRQWEQAISAFGQAADLDPGRGDPGLAVLVPYFLGMALEREGYDAAAAEVHHRLLKGGLDGRYSARFNRDVSVLMRREAELWRRLGDAFHRIDRPDRALAAYHRASELEPGLPEPLAARLTYALLRLEHPGAAWALVLDQLELTAASDATLRLLEYLTDRHPPDAHFTAQLEQLYNRLDKPRRIVLLLARTEPPSRAQSLLAEHLRAHPDDERVLDRLLDVAVQRDRPRAWREAVAAVVAAMENEPGQARHFASRLLQARGGPRPLLEALDRLPSGPGRSAAAHFLRGSAWETGGEVDKAAQALQRAIETAPDFHTARLRLAANRLRAGEPEQARRWLEPLWDRPEPRIAALAATILARLDEAEAADALLERAIDEAGDGPAMFIAAARVRDRVLGDAEAARRTLDAGIERYPRDEALRSALIGYLRHHRPDDRPALVAAIREVFDAIPQSRLARMLRVREVHAPQRHFDRALRELRAMLAADEDDYEALAALLRVHAADGQPQRATELIERRMAEAPSDGRLRNLAIEHYRRIGDHPRRLALQRDNIEAQLPGPRQQVELARLELDTGQARQARNRILRMLRRDDGERVGEKLFLLARALRQSGREDAIAGHIESAMQRFPEQRGSLKLLLAAELFERGDVDEALAMHQRVLEERGDDPIALNQTAYLLARAGRDLDRAEALIERALEQHPTRAEMLDTLGWVRYRRGDFSGAADALMRAVRHSGGEHPVILDHLGDTLYRLGRQDQAIDLWRNAKRLLQRHHVLDDPERIRTAADLERKLDAAEAGQPIPVAPTVEEADERQDMEARVPMP